MSGRNTRFQKDLIKKTRNEARLEKRMKKRNRKPPGSSIEPKAKKAKTSTRPVNGEPNNGTSSRDSPLPDRPRRSTVNYARDKSLRDSYDSNGSNKQKRDLQVKIREFEEESEFRHNEEDITNSDNLAVLSLPKSQLPKRRFSDSDLFVGPAPKIEPKRRASLSDLVEADTKITPKLHFDAIYNEVKPNIIKRRATTHTEELTALTSVKNDQASEGKKRRLSLDVELSLDRKPPPKSSAVRVTLDYSPSQLKDLERAPANEDILVEEVPDHLSDNDDKLSTDSGASSSSTVSSSRMRKKRRSSPSLLASDGRLMFPKEVKISALERIQNGETQIQVARDLQCPISTVSTWWKKREVLMMASPKPEIETMAEIMAVRQPEADESGISVS